MIPFLIPLDFLLFQSRILTSQGIICLGSQAKQHDHQENPEAGFAKKLLNLPREPEGVWVGAPKPVPSSAGLKPFTRVGRAESQHWPLANPLVRVPNIYYSQEPVWTGFSSREGKSLHAQRDKGRQETVTYKTQQPQQLRTYPDQHHLKLFTWIVSTSQPLSQVGL